MSIGRRRMVTALFSVAIAACAATGEEDADTSASNLGAGEAFDKNDVIDDAMLSDSAPAAADAAKIQAFLETTPFRNWFFFRTTSPLAAYRDGGKLASEILTTVARKHRINPIALLVALETEQSLVSATSLDEDAVKLAFRCGCPDGDECSTSPELYIGFAKQAECYAGTLRAAVDAQTAGKPTKTGWKRGAPRLTSDQPTKILVTPANMATAALYSYTPVVGKKGGGDRALGGTSNHWEIAKRFTTALSYEGPLRAPPVDVDAGASPSTPDAGAEPTPEPTPTPTPTPDPDPTPDPTPEPTPTPTPEPTPEPIPTPVPARVDAGTPARPDAGAPMASDDGMKAPGKPTTTKAEANETAQLPSGHGVEDRERPEKPEPELAERKPTSAASSGCTASPRGGPAGGLLAAAAMMVLALRGRRRA